MYRFIYVLIWGTVFLISACSDSSTPTLELDKPVPFVHSFPAWHNSDVLLFENLGAVATGPGWATVHLPSSGIVQWNLETGESALLVQSGITPSSTGNGQGYCCILEDQNNSVVLGGDNGWAVLEDREGWSFRSNTSLSHDGALFAWRGGLDEVIGIWIYSIQTQECIFVGDGSFPIWHPEEDILLYRANTESDIPFLVEFNFASSVVDTILHFPENTSGKHFSYSPDASQIAYYASSLLPIESGIHVYDTETNEIHKINNHTGFGLSWGERGLVYSRSCGDIEDPGCGVLWIVDTQTWLSRQLTERFQFIFDEDSLPTCH